MFNHVNHVSLKENRQRRDPENVVGKNKIKLCMKKQNVRIGSEKPRQEKNEERLHKKERKLIKTSESVDSCAATNAHNSRMPRNRLNSLLISLTYS